MLKDNLGFVHLACCLEEFDEILVRGGPGKVLDKDLLRWRCGWRSGACAGRSGRAASVSSRGSVTIAVSATVRSSVGVGAVSTTVRVTVSTTVSGAVATTSTIATTRGEPASSSEASTGRGRSVSTSSVRIHGRTSSKLVQSHFEHAAAEVVAVVHGNSVGSVVRVAECNDTGTFGAAIGTHVDVGTRNVTSGPEEILEVLPADIVGKLRKVRMKKKYASRVEYGLVDNAMTALGEGKREAYLRWKQRAG